MTSHDLWLRGVLNVAAVVVSFAINTTPAPKPPTVKLPLEKLELHELRSEAATWKGRAGIHVVDAGENDSAATGLAVVPGSALENGTISVDVSGDTLPTANATARGFVGVAFRVSDDRARYECFYLRPKNGRADDQLRRNHSAQYISVPGFPWEKLRAETPGQYESYVDIVPSEWIHVKIRVSGGRAELFVNGNEQPTLIVPDLKQKPASGAVALWLGPGTDAHFANLEVTPE